MIIFAALLTSAVFFNSLWENQISEVSALGKALATNSALTTLE